MRLPFFGKKKSSSSDSSDSADNIATIERQTCSKIRAFLDLPDTISKKGPAQGRTLADTVVSLSNHADKTGEAKQNYAGIQLDVFEGDLGYGTSTTITPRLTNTGKAERGRASPVTLKFTRFMNDAAALSLTEKMWSQIGSSERRALLLNSTSEKLAQRVASRDRQIAEAKTHPQDEDDLHYRYQDEFYILYLVACKEALVTNQFQYVFHEDGNLSFVPTGALGEKAQLIRQAYGKSGWDEEEYETEFGTPKPATDEILATLKKQL